MPRLKQFALIEAFSIKEVLVFILLFVSAMVVVFPAGRLEELLLSGDKLNSQLRVKYLEALVRIKESPELLEALALSYASLGRRREALRITRELERFPNFNLRALKVRYELLKYDYFALKGRADKRALERELESVLLHIATLESKADALERVYRESVSLGLHRVALYTARKLAGITHDPLWIKRALEHAFILKDRSAVFSIVKEIKGSDPDTLLLLYRAYASVGELRKALYSLQGLVSRYPRMREKYLVELLYIYDRLGESALPFLVSLISKEKNELRRKMLIMLSIKYYLGRGEYGTVKELVKTYATAFPDDSIFTKFMLEVSLATGDPKFAGYIAERIAESIGVVNGSSS
ncbi:hypothetical protein [Hydrogenivirga sp. 128-5-R1-1]|uniref:hypothetical protein n=1 Tax=Hydrogenivirga sp. 128-5-R1-1 TaxID=392423 RepID=UPI00015F17F9|nr:hypothetical protein [Hydrogenivirga sp. 128-5-R1-1]EDP76228.1 hypothetical protein HG1285_18699 [Hydrogenivirga sp. 128-5-R1-1]